MRAVIFIFTRRCVLSIDGWQTLSPQLLVVTIVISNPRHSRVLPFAQATFEFISIGKASHTGTTTGTTTGAFAMTRQSVTSGELAIAFGTYMWLFASVQFAVPF
jgi:hypothetical protein